MPISVSYNGVTYNIPGAGEQNWSGTNGVDGFLIAVGEQSLQLSGGLFSLAADLDLGPTAGFITTYIKSRSSNIASSGFIRCANGDSISFRNHANNGNLTLSPLTNDQLAFNGSQLLTSPGALTASRVLNTDVSGNVAASSVTSTTLGFLDATSSIQTQLNGKQASFSVLPIANGGTNSGTSLNNNRVVQSSGGAIIEAAAITANRALISDGNGIPTQSATTNTEIGYVAGVTSAVQTQIDTKQAARNYFINGNLDFWQRGTSITGIANGTSVYGPDRIYAKNSLGTNGVMSLTQAAGSTGTYSGTLYACQAKITTAPTAAQANGCEVYTTLENGDSLSLYNQTASFSVSIVGLGNVNQVGVQFFYKTTEAKVDTSIGSEVLTTINTSTYTTCSISGQALGTSQTTAGVIGVRIRITGVSSGNTYDLNNGFQFQQAQITRTSTPAAFQRAGDTFSEELRMCQRFYWRFIGGSNFTLPGGGFFQTTTGVINVIQFPVTMHTAPTCAVSIGSDLAISRPGTSNASGSGTPTYVGITQFSVQMNCTAASTSTAGFATLVGIQSGGWFEASAEI